MFLISLCHDFYGHIGVEVMHDHFLAFNYDGHYFGLKHGHYLGLLRGHYLWLKRGHYLGLKRGHYRILVLSEITVLV